MIDFELIFLIILVLSVVQSVLGVGLLVFGTPTLLLLGVEFDTTLSLLLPSSIVISLLQVKDGIANIKDNGFMRNYNLYCLPMVLVGTILTIFVVKKVDLSLLVGGIMLLSGLVRLSSVLNNKLETVIHKNNRSYLLGLGFIHGLTNMGGGALTIYSATIFKNKNDVRSGIAYGYLLMGLVQYATLIIYDVSFLSSKTFLFMGVSFLAYYLIGRFVFKFTSGKVYNNVVTGVVLFYGLSLLVF